MAAPQDPAPEPEVLAPEVAMDVPPELIAAVLQRLPSNEVAPTARRTCRAAAQHLTDAHLHRTASVDQPLPPHAASSPVPEAAAGAAFRRLTFHRKLRVLSVAAASGCGANLEVAWPLLQSCLFPELLQTEGFYLRQLRCEVRAAEDAGTAAVRGGYVRALGWLVADGALSYPGGLAGHLVVGRAALHAGAVAGGVGAAVCAAGGCRVRRRWERPGWRGPGRSGKVKHTR